MSRFGSEIHTYHPEAGAPTRKLPEVPTAPSEDAPTSEIAIEDMDTSAGFIPRMSTDEQKAERVKKALLAVAEYAADPPVSSEPRYHTQPLEWKPGNPEFAQGIERADAAHEAFVAAKARGTSKEKVIELENKADQAMHEAALAEMARERNKFIAEHPVTYRTEQGAMDPSRPDTWTPEQLQNFPNIVYALHKQGMEYRLSPDIPPEKRADFETVIARAKRGEYAPGAATETKKKSFAVAFLAGIARAISQRRRRK